MTRTEKIIEGGAEGSARAMYAVADDAVESETCCPREGMPCMNYSNCTECWLAYLNETEEEA